MQIGFRLLRLLPVLCLACVCFALFSGNAARVKHLDPVKWQHVVKRPSRLKPGDVIRIKFTAEISDGYYMYAARPAEGVGPHPTEFKLDSQALKGLEPYGALKDLTPPQVVYDDVFGMDIYLHKQQAVFQQKLRVTEENPQLSAYLSYQVCNPKACIYNTYEIDLNND